jgi:hypothetical protein
MQRSGGSFLRENQNNPRRHLLARNRRAFVLRMFLLQIRTRGTAMNDFEITLGNCISVDIDYQEHERDMLPEQIDLFEEEV